MQLAKEIKSSLATAGAVRDEFLLFPDKAFGPV